MYMQIKFYYGEQNEINVLLTPKNIKKKKKKTRKKERNTQLN